MKTLYLIDASGLIFRAFYALPPLTRTNGTPVGAVYGFCTMLLKLRDVILKHSPYATVLWASIFDVSRRNFRHDIAPDYKANRQETPPALAPQFALIREACPAFGCPVREVPGFEADDVIASYVERAISLHIPAVVVSSDKDLMQLKGPGVELYDPMKMRWVEEEDVIAKFGVEPAKVPYVQALSGDAADGITGVPGIGLKIAAELIHQFGTLEALLAGAVAIPQKKRREQIMQHVDEARIAYQLVTLRKDVEVDWNEAEMTFPAFLDVAAKKRMQMFCDQMGFTELKQRIKGKEDEKMTMGE